MTRVESIHETRAHRGMSRGGQAIGLSNLIGAVWRPTTGIDSLSIPLSLSRVLNLERVWVENESTRLSLSRV